VGAAVTWTLSNIPATSAISAHLLSFGAIPAPGIDLGFIGAPGCAQLITLPATTILVFGTPTANSTLLIPGAPSLAGLTLHSQGASLGTTANALGVLTSNAITTVLGFF
jgi:hypothetical protein